MMLGNGTHRRIVASTLAEIRGVLPLVKEGVLDEVGQLHALSIASRLYQTDTSSAFTAFPCIPAHCLNYPSCASQSRSSS